MIPYVEVNRVVDTTLLMLQEHDGVFNTIISTYCGPRKMTYFKGIRNYIAQSNLPSIEVGPVSDNPKWFATRTISSNLQLEIHVTISAYEPEVAMDLEGKLVALTTKILTSPVSLRRPIAGTLSTIYDGELPSVRFGAAKSRGDIRVSQLSWGPKILVYLSDADFPEEILRGGPSPICRS